MFALKKELLQKYVRNWITEGWIDTKGKYYYEFTVTFNMSYWSLADAMESVPQIIADVLKPVIRSTDTFTIRYSVEYHKNGMPHVHGQVSSGFPLHPDIQRAIHQRLIRRYGRSQWFQTGIEDKVHVNESYPDGIPWSEYIIKDVVLNEKNGLRHYYEYNF